MSEPKSRKVVGGYEIDLKGRGRQFENDFLEKLSYCPGWLPLVFYVPVVLLCLYLAVTDTPLGVATIAGVTIGGLAFWTLAEYWLHRTFFHWKRFQKLHYFVHGIHHQYPNDLYRLVFPPGASAFLAVPIWFILYFTVGYELALPFFAGFVSGYLWYDMTHYWTHVGKPRSAWGKTLRRQHMLHHFHTPDDNFGVTSPFWDRVFGTYQPTKLDQTPVGKAA